MKAGPELDALVAEKVMGWRMFPYVMPDAEAPQGWRHEWCPPGPVHISTIEPLPPYSTDIAAAWTVVEHFKAQQRAVILDGEDGYDSGRWVMKIDKNGLRDEWDVAVADAAPLAICLAALRAAGGEEEK